jgi:hypothetical protein
MKNHENIPSSEKPTNPNIVDLRGIKLGDKTESADTVDLKDITTNRFNVLNRTDDIIKHQDLADSSTPQESSIFSYENMRDKAASLKKYSKATFGALGTAYDYTKKAAEFTYKAAGKVSDSVSDIERIQGEILSSVFEKAKSKKVITALGIIGMSAAIWAVAHTHDPKDTDQYKPSVKTETVSTTSTEKNKTDDKKEEKKDTQPTNQFRLNLAPTNHK